MKIQNPAFLLFIEPESPATPPIIDTYTRKITGAFRNAKSGTSGYSQQLPQFIVSQSGYKGLHTCDCGHAASSNQDYLMATKEQVLSMLFSDRNSFFSGDASAAQQVQAVITNSLCIHYVACHRDSISTGELVRILLLEGEEAIPTEEELQCEAKKPFTEEEYDDPLDTGGGNLN